MKSIVSEVREKRREDTYPRLMKSESGAVVMFTNHEVGFVVSAGTSHNPLGRLSYTWTMSAFVPFQGSITLSND